MTKKLTLNEYLKQQEKFYEEHVKFHPANAFCGTAGDEEMRHIERLIDKLSDKELEELVTKAGISFDSSVDREAYENVIDEIDREDFYKLYRIITTRNKKP